MLVLSRRQGESVLIAFEDGTEAVVTVKRVGTVTRLCFDAPRSVRIVRTELIERSESDDGNAS